MKMKTRNKNSLKIDDLRLEVKFQNLLIGENKEVKNKL
jgi:hypothetical protein